MKILLLALLILSGVHANAGTSIICRPDGTCDIVITQDNTRSSDNEVIIRR